MPSSDASPRTRSRTSSLLLTAVALTVPVAIFLIFSFGEVAGTGLLVVVWLSTIVWLVRKRRDDPEWDRRPLFPR